MPRRVAARTGESSIPVVAVAGTTSWGVTLAWLLARNGAGVTLLCRTEDEATEINRTRRAHRATTLELPASITATASVATARDADALLIAVPSQHVRATARTLRDAVPHERLVIHATKGLERGSALRVSEVLRAEWPNLDPGAICALSGPNLAPEIQRGLPAATVIASDDEESASAAQRLFHGGAFRAYVSEDLAGVELAGSLKNVVALAAGIADGMAMGDNAKAGIITRGIAEITRLGVACGAQAATFAGLAGAGDVMATCYSPLSRNRRTGEAIGNGASVADAVGAAGGVVEGIEATAAACGLAARHGVEMPIAEALRAVLFEGASTGEMIRRLLEREATRESA